MLAEMLWATKTIIKAAALGSKKNDDDDDDDNRPYKKHMNKSGNRQMCWVIEASKQSVLPLLSLQYTFPLSTRVLGWYRECVKAPLCTSVRFIYTKNRLNLNPLLRSNTHTHSHTHTSAHIERNHTNDYDDNDNNDVVNSIRNNDCSVRCTVNTLARLWT